jgi:hypothetical protein
VAEPSNIKMRLKIMSWKLNYKDTTDRSKNAIIISINKQSLLSTITRTAKQKTSQSFENRKHAILHYHHGYPPPHCHQRCRLCSPSPRPESRYRCRGRAIRGRGRYPSTPNSGTMPIWHLQVQWEKHRKT